MANELSLDGSDCYYQGQEELLHKRDLIEQELLKLTVAPDVALERANNIVQALSMDPDESVQQIVSEMLSKYIEESNQVSLVYTIKKICSRRSRPPTPAKI